MDDPRSLLSTPSSVQWHCESLEMLKKGTPCNNKLATISVYAVLKSAHKFTDGELGIKGYKVPTNTGLLYSYPKYSVPKDKLQNFLEKIKRTSSAIPGPPHYKVELSWKVAQGKFLKGIKRNFIEELQSRE